MVFIMNKLSQYYDLFYILFEQIQAFFWWAEIADITDDLDLAAFLSSIYVLGYV